MLKRIVEISQEGRYLSKHAGFIRISSQDEVIGQVPLNDIGIMMVSAHGATMSKEALVGLSENGAISILCGEKSQPSAYILPVTGNFEMARRYKSQVAASKPLQKRLWQKIVKSKIDGQISVLRS